MLTKIKSYWILISSALVGILWFLLTQSKTKGRQARVEAERLKLHKELESDKVKAKIAREGADNAYNDYKKLLDRHPDIRDSLSNSK